jgi:hypothetical protein
MRHTTDFIGHIDIEPALNQDEIGYLTAVGASRRLRWVPCWTGCCLSFEGAERCHEPVPWLRYVIAHLLKPGASASRSGLARFASFSFDHRLDGMVVGCRRDTKELTAITVRANRVTTRTLRAPDPRHAGWPPSAYADQLDGQLDRQRVERRGRRRDGEAGKVIDLSSVFPGPA